MADRKTFSLQWETKQGFWGYTQVEAEDHEEAITFFNDVLRGKKFPIDAEVMESHIVK